MKSSATMRSIAKAMAVSHGVREVELTDGHKAAAYTMTKDELKMIFELNGFNTRGVSWLNMIGRWRIVGEVIPAESVLKNSDNWWVAFTTINDIEKSRLESYAAYYEIGNVLA